MSVKSEARTRLIIAGIVLVFSIVALFAINGGLAWFADSDNVSANNMQVSIAGSDQITADLISYGVLAIDSANGVYTYNLQEEILDLPVNDPAGIGYDIYLQALVVRINVHVTEATTLTLSVDTERDISLENINWFSNVTSYSYAVAAASGNNETANVQKAAASQSFVTFPSGSTTPEHSSTITLASDITVTPENPYIYVVIEYNQDFINYINAYLMDKQDKVVRYSNDNDIKFVLNVAN